MNPIKSFPLIIAALAMTACSQNAQSTSDNMKSEDTQTEAVQAVSQADLIDALKEAPSGVYELEKTHGYIHFSYMHQGFSRPMLRWRHWDSTLNWDQADPAQSSVSVEIDVNAIDSGVDVFDEHLLDEKFFNVKTFPTISFQSTSLERTDGMSGKMVGDLTMKGITKPVALDVTFNRAAMDRSGAPKIGFSAVGTLKRSDWDLGLYVPHVSDEVEVVIEVEYLKTP